MKSKNAPILCPVSALFEVIQSDLVLGICCDITFVIENKKHSIGVWGDNGNTYQNVTFYFDQQEFKTLEDLKKCKLSNGTYLMDYPKNVLVKECDGCYPKEDKILRQYA